MLRCWFVKVNAASFSGRKGCGRTAVTLSGVQFCLATVTLDSSISSLSRMGYSHLLNSIVLLCEKEVTAERFKKERPSIEKDTVRASILGKGKSNMRSGRRMDLEVNAENCRSESLSLRYLGLLLEIVL